MTYAEPIPAQIAATAAFVGAQRAERYFEEAPTETVRHAAPAAARGIVARVPDHLTGTPQIVDEASGSMSEDVLRRVVPPTSFAPASTPTRPPQPRPARSPWGRRRHADEEMQRARSAIRSAAWSRSVGILVANPKGSVGKTPASLLLGGVFASIRGGQTVVLEVTDDPGSLALRAEGPAWAGLGELMRDAAAIRGAGQLAAYCAQQTSFAAVVGSPRDREPLDHNHVASLNGLLEYFYPIRVMDSGNQVTSHAFFGAVQASDVLIIPVVDAADAVAGAEQLLRHLRRVGGHAAQLAETAVALRLDDGRRNSADSHQHVTDTLSAAGVRTVVDIPFDPHIAERSTLTLSQLRPATVDAFTRAAAIVCEQLTARLR